MASNSFSTFSLLGNPYDANNNRSPQLVNETTARPFQSSMPIGIDGLSPHTDAVINNSNSFTSCSPIGEVMFPTNNSQGRSAPAHIVGLFGPLDGSADFIKSLTLSPSFSPDKGELDYSSDSDDDEEFSLPPSLVNDYDAIFPSDYDTNVQPDHRLAPSQLNVHSPSSFLFQNSPSNSPLMGASPFGASPSLNPHLSMATHNSLPSANKASATSSPSGFEDSFDEAYPESHYTDNYSNDEGITSPSTTQYGEHPFGEHPSRTLFVRNINSNVEDEELRQLFEGYGEIRSMYTQCKHRGFVMISYFDIRHAKSAMRHLQSKVIRRRKLDIHYSIPKDNPSEKDQNQGTLVVFNLDPSITCDELRKIFGGFGEIKEIRETPNKKHHKFIEFYDVRDADRAMKSLNKTEIKSKKIKIEPSRPGGARKNLINQLQSPELNASNSDDFEPQSPSLSSTNSTPSPAFSPLVNPGGGTSPSPFHLYNSPSLNGNNSPITSPAPPIDLSSFNTAYSIPRSPTLTGQYSPKQKSILTSPSLSANSNPPGFNMNGNTMSSYLLSNGNGANPYLLNSMNSNNNGNNEYNLDPSAYSFFNNPMSQNQNKNGMPAHKPRRNSVKSFNNTNNTRTTPWSPNSLYPMNSLSPILSSSGPTITQMGNGSSPQMMAGPPVSSTGHKASRSYSLPVGGVKMSNNNNIQSEQIEKSNFELDKMKRPNNHHHKDHDDNGNNNSNKSNVSYTLDIDAVLNGSERRTTLMIKNIPNKYTQKMLLATVDEHHKGLYDFFYLPIDFKNKCNVGYAFINFIDPVSIVSLYRQLHNNKWEKFNSEKVCEITYARIQGKESLISHFQNSSLMSEDKKCRPIIFHSDGPNQGQQAPFPIGPNVRVRSKEDSGMKSPLSNNNNNTRRAPLTPQKLISNTVENGKSSERTTSVRTRSYSYK